MLLISSQNYDFARQHPYQQDGSGNDRAADAHRLSVVRICSDSFPYENETYYWTDEGHGVGYDGQNGINHDLPLINLACDHRSKDAFLEAVAAHSATTLAIVFFLILGIIGLVGSVSLERTERASQIARI